MPPWASSLLHDAGLVVFSVGLSWLIGTYVSWQREKRNIRLLLSAEILENYDRLALLYTRFIALRLLVESSRDYGQLRNAPLVLHDTNLWSRARWEMAGVGTALKPSEVMQVSVWYSGLDMITMVQTVFVQRIEFLRECEAASENVDKEVAWEELFPSLQEGKEFIGKYVDAGPPFVNEELKRLRHAERQQVTAIRKQIELQWRQQAQARGQSGASGIIQP